MVSNCIAYILLGVGEQDIHGITAIVALYIPVVSNSIAYSLLGVGEQDIPGITAIVALYIPVVSNCIAYSLLGVVNNIYPVSQLLLHCIHYTVYQWLVTV